MIIHVLPGDSLTEEFGKSTFDGETVICRECLIDGDVSAVCAEEFWEARAAFIAGAYGEDHQSYFRMVVTEFEKLENPAITEINLWFEHELFCQTNFWFTLYFLSKSRARIYRVLPPAEKSDQIWKGFSSLNAGGLEECFSARVEMNETDRLLGANLWKAYQSRNYSMLKKLSTTKSSCYLYLAEVCRAEIEKRSRPLSVLREILAGGQTDFADIYREFSARAGVFGFGDAQVKRLLAEIL